MHELGVTFHIMDQLEKVAQENDVERVRKVVLELGEVSTVIESYLHFDQKAELMFTFCATYGKI